MRPASAGLFPKPADGAERPPQVETTGETIIVVYCYIIVGDGFPVPAVHGYEFAQQPGEFAASYRWEAKRLPYIHHPSQCEKT